MRNIISLVIGLILLAPVAGFGQEPDFEAFRIEFTGAVWPLMTTGQVQSGIIPVDLKSDLGIRGNRSHFAGRLALKPGRKHRLLVEGIPFRLSGDNRISREITFSGRTYTIDDTITTRAEVNYLFGGYQYDFVSRPRGHVGVLAGAAYFDAKATLRSVATSRTATESRKVPFPLVGMEFRGFPLTDSNRINLNGEIKGMSFGDYGRYLQGSVHLGFSLGRHVTLQAGYSTLDLKVRDKSGNKGIDPRFSGPVFSVQFRDR